MYFWEPEFHGSGCPREICTSEGFQLGPLEGLELGGLWDYDSVESFRVSLDVDSNVYV